MGSYSECKRCVHKATNMEYAVKVGLLTTSRPRLLGWGQVPVWWGGVVPELCRCMKGVWPRPPGLLHGQKGPWTLSL